MPILLLGGGLLKSFTTLGRQAVPDLVADGTQAAERCQEVRAVVAVIRALGRAIIGNGGDPRGRGLEVGIRDHEIAWDAGAQGWEDLGLGIEIIRVGGRDWLDACLCRLHDGGILNGVGVDIVHSFVVAPPNCVDLSVEVPVEEH